MLGIKVIWYRLKIYGRVNFFELGCRSHSLPTVRHRPSDSTDSYSNFKSRDKAIMADTFDDFYIREEYSQRIEKLLNEKENMQLQINSLAREKDLQLKAQQQQHVKEFESQWNQIKELSQKMKNYIEKT